MATERVYTPCTDCPHSPSHQNDLEVCQKCEFRNSIRGEAHWKKVMHPIWSGFTVDVCPICGWANDKNAYTESMGRRKPLKFCGNCGIRMKS